MTPSGDLVDWGQNQNPFQITDTQRFDRLKPALAWNGNHFLVAWTNINTIDGHNLSGRKVSSEGSVLDISDVVFLSDDFNKAFLAIVWDEEGFLMVWEQEPEGETKMMGLPFNRSIILW